MSINRLATLIAGGAVAAAALTAVPAQAADSWVVIAYSPATGAVGWASAPTKQAASDAATGYCVQYGGTDCQPAAWASNACAALAIRPNGLWHGGVGPTIQAAEDNALGQNNGGTIDTSKCSF